MGKYRFELVDIDYIAEMADVLEAGLKNERKPDDWKRIKWNDEWESIYLGKVLSHVHKYRNSVQSRDKIRHAAAIGCNGMILAYYLRVVPNVFKELFNACKVR